MEGMAYGAGKAGGAFDPVTFFQQPQTILRIVSWIFSIVVFGSIANEGYVNRPREAEQHCVFNRNASACRYGVTVGALAFLCCLALLALDAHFPRVSSVKDRKRAVLADVGVSAFWAFMWFVGFCFLANQWQESKPEDDPLREGGDAARAAITFSFFSIFTWAAQTLLSLERLKVVSFEEEYSKLFTPQPPPLPPAAQSILAYQRYRLGADSALFGDYADPSQDAAVAAATAPYAAFGGGEEPDSPGGGAGGSGGYQRGEY